MVVEDSTAPGCDETLLTLNADRCCTVNPLLSPPPPPPPPSSNKPALSNNPYLVKGRKLNKPPSPPSYYSPPINNRLYLSMSTIKLSMD